MPATSSTEPHSATTPFKRRTNAPTLRTPVQDIRTSPLHAPAARVLTRSGRSTNESIASPEHQPTRVLNQSSASHSHTATPPSHAAAHSPIQPTPPSPAPTHPPQPRPDRSHTPPRRHHHTAANQPGTAQITGTEQSNAVRQPQPIRPHTTKITITTRRRPNRPSNDNRTPMDRFVPRSVHRQSSRRRWGLV